eukprot:1649998-Rhodomonas_salina.2
MSTLGCFLFSPSSLLFPSLGFSLPHSSHSLKRRAQPERGSFKFFGERKVAVSEREGEGEGLGVVEPKGWYHHATSVAGHATSGAPVLRTVRLGQQYGWACSRVHYRVVAKAVQEILASYSSVLGVA